MPASRWHRVLVYTGGVFLLTLLAVFSYALVDMFHIGDGMFDFPRRDDPPPNKNDLIWSNGRVIIQDYCSHPGTKDVEVVWLGADGKRVVLVDAGDTDCTQARIQEGKLRVQYQVRYPPDGRLEDMDAVFESPWKKVP